MSVLVIDVGSSSVRASILDDDGALGASLRAPTPPARSASGAVEIDAAAIAKAAIELATELATSADNIHAVGIATQRASSVVWERHSGEPIGPGLSWQDLRTTGQCFALRAAGLRLMPSQSATKFAWLLGQAGGRARDELCCGTLDSYVAFALSGGELHVTDPSNAAVTGLVTKDATDWDDAVLDALGLPRSAMASIVDSARALAPARALGIDAPVASLLGDQQASLLGQGCVEPGDTKATFGTGAMFDRCLGPGPAPEPRGATGTFAIACWRIGGETTWGSEAIELSAGSCLEWLRDGLGIIDNTAASGEIASGVRDSGGVVFVPALGGLATPVWDYGARGTLIGISGSTTRAEVVRAVLEGVAHRGRDLLEAIEADTDGEVGEVRVDGGMSANATFVQILADTLGRPVRCSDELEATTRGAGLAAGIAIGTFASLRDAAAHVPPGRVVEPARSVDRERWLDARERALRTVPALSMLSF